MRIILADKNQKTVWALITVIQEEPAMELVGEAENSEELLQMAENATVDLILLDRKLAGDPIKSLISELHAIEPRPIVLGMSWDAEDGRLMLNAGADAFVSKGDRPDWLLDILRGYAKRIQKTGKPK
jgi:DNA-binding NarL/FixJ family response regulator